MKTFLTYIGLFLRNLLGIAFYPIASSIMLVANKKPEFVRFHRYIAITGAVFAFIIGAHWLALSPHEEIGWGAAFLDTARRYAWPYAGFGFISWIMACVMWHKPPY